MDLLERGGLAQSPRRARSLARSIAAVHGARIAHGAEHPALEESAELTLQSALPQNAEEVPPGFAKLVGAHRQAWEVASLARDDSRRMVLGENDPGRRIEVAARLGLSSDALSRTVTQALAAEPCDARRLGLATSVFVAFRTRASLTPAAWEALARLARRVLEPRQRSENVAPGPDLERWREIQSALAREDADAPAVFAARRLRTALAQVRSANAAVLGPDGKVLVRLVEGRESFRWDLVNLAVQHAAGVGYEALHRLVLPALEAEAKALDAALPGLGASFDVGRVRLNGGGDFSCGGPFGDNGLSGKKLVVDHYGPGVPIGGGALCGKDPHKVDRAGALRARQLAVRIVRDAGAREASVRLGFLPGLREPAFLDARVDERWWDRRRIERAIAVPDLSLEGSFRDLDLASVRWSEVLAGGYFGGGWAWER